MCFPKLVHALIAISLAGGLLSACGRKLDRVLLDNEKPTIELVSEAGAAGTFQFRWHGVDVDGRIAHYLWAVDPRSVDSVDASWQRTNETLRRVEAGQAPLAGAESAETREPHLFAVRAVDDRGDLSEAKAVGYFGGNLAPIVDITHPRPSSLITIVTGRSLTISWRGLDPDGVFTNRPVKYKYIVLTEHSEFPLSLAVLNPDSLRRFYAPKFATWDSTSGDTTQVHYRNFTPHRDYLFVITGFDEAGDYDPVFSLSKNMLRFRVGFDKTLGPRLTLFGESFFFTYASTGYSSDSSRYVRVEVPPGLPLTFQWFGTPGPGLDLKGYRWKLDPQDPHDESTRTDPSDFHHWSQQDLATSVTLGPFGAGPKGEVHRLFIEAEDSIGLRSLGIIDFFVAPARPEKDLLIVDDTRRVPDQLNATMSCVRPPTGLWPTAAELDTFLFAVGSVPWKCYAEGIKSTPGLFAGYRYDTIGTRGLASGAIPLSQLARYRHVIWYVDPSAASNTQPVDHPLSPATSLRFMSGAGRTNTLTSYAQGGGKLWVLGGGAGAASNLPWNDVNNDIPTLVFSKNSPRAELVPGRFMYSAARWQSEFRVVRSQAQITRFTGRLSNDPRYASFPAALEAKNTTSDPLPPSRTSSQFYQSLIDVEFLQLPNEIVEDGRSTLDSLYKASGSSFPQPSINPHNVAMTVYEGSSPGQVVFSGFNFWSFKRAQCVALVDAVLQDLWGLSRSEPSRSFRASRPDP